MNGKKILSICSGFLLNAILWTMPLPANAQYQTLGPGSCGLGQSNCHTNENNWWKDDAHHATVDAFYDDPANYEKIAQLFGVGAGNMLKGSQRCASCHGTVISGKESREVEDGVSCESCHGPGSGYKDPHSEKAGGYEKALKLGMAELKNVDTRANACVRCHYIADQKLIAAGHPDGAKFNYISGIKKIARHWRRQPGGDDLAKAPFEKAMQAKGPVAQLVKVEPAAAPVSGPPAGTVAAAEPPAKSAAVAAREMAKTTRVEAPVANTPKPIRQNKPEPMMPPPMPTAATMTEDTVALAAPIALPPFPNISDTTSVKEILLIVKKRLELLHQKTGNFPN
jgi:hypothetical protein